MTERSIGRTDYVGWSRLLGAEPDETLSPSQRADDMPAWMTPELIASPHAVGRLRSWVGIGQPVYPPDDLRRLLAFIGDPEVRDVVTEAMITRIPPPVVHHVLAHTWVFGIGWASVGMMSHAPTLPGGPEPLSLIQVTGTSRNAEEVASTFGHEVGHFWTMPPPEVTPLSMREREERYVGLMREYAAAGRSEFVVSVEVRNEEMAVACARVWGFTGASADGDRCVSATRDRVRLEAAALRP